jgi:hypothetical protein
MTPVTSPVTDAANDAANDAVTDAANDAVTGAATDDRRCTVLSLAADEELAGSAPTDAAWLLVEHAGPWGRRALDEARLPEEVRVFLTGLEGVRVQLIRRPGGVSGPGVRVFAAQLTPDGARVRTVLLDDHRDLLRLDVGALADGGGLGLTAYDAALWLVCTNGRRDRCCTEAGRPVAATLAGHWPEATWETTHLGGHRFAATLLALPAGVVLGRLDVETAVTACRDLEAGRVPVGVTRGRAGTAPRAQVAELHLRRELDEPALDAVRVTRVDGGTVTLTTPVGAWQVRVGVTAGAPRRQSCGDWTGRSADVYAVEAWVRLDP